MSSTKILEAGEQKLLAGGRRNFCGKAAFLLLFAMRLAFGTENSGPPQLTQVQPMSGVVGDRMIIRGLDLATTSKVEFNGVTAQFFLSGDISPGQWTINAYVPAGATTGPIKVTTNYGTATTTDSFTVLPGEPPTIDSFSPASGPPGTHIIIYGDLEHTTNVLLNGVAMQWSPGTAPVSWLYALIPTNGTTGPITVSSTFGSATTTTNFTVTPVPPLTIIQWPLETEAGAYAVLTVNDSSLLTNVQLNGENLLYEPMMPTEVWIAIPTNAVSGPLTLFSATGSLTSPEPLIVHPNPILSSLTPTSGPAGTVVQLVGENFGLVSDVWLGGLSVVFTRLADGLISFAAPTNVITGMISVFTPYNRTVSGLTFTVTVSSGQITTRSGTIRGPVPPTDPTPITGITNMPPTHTVGTTDATGTLAKPALLSQVAPSSPLLSIVSAGKSALKLTWPKVNSTWVLESSASSVGRAWAPIPLSPSVSEGEYQLVLPAAGPQQFFRLRVFSE